MSKCGRKSLVWDFRKGLLTLSAEELFRVARAVDPTLDVDQSELMEEDQEIFGHPSPTREQSAFTMKTLPLFSVIVFAALSIRGATVGPVKAAAVDQEDKSEPEQEVGADIAVADKAAQRQVGLQFCLDGWLSFRGSCYYIENYPDSWRNAESFCVGFGGTLVSVHNIWEYQFLQRMVKTAGHAFAWIGATSLRGNGDGKMAQCSSQLGLIELN